MKTPCIRLFIAAATLAFAGSASAVPTLLDGSFEMPAISSGTQLGGGVSWTPTYDSTGKGVYVASSANSFLGQTAFGTQFLTLNQGTADSQALTGFSIGTSYTVIAYFADLLNGAAPALTISLNPLGVSSTVFSQTFTAPQSGGAGYGAGVNIPYVKATYTFTALVPNYTLTLTNSSTAAGTIAVDNVSIPEPSSLMALFLGLGVVGTAVVKLRRQTA